MRWQRLGPTTASHSAPRSRPRPVGCGSRDHHGRAPVGRASWPRRPLQHGDPFARAERGGYRAAASAPYRTAGFKRLGAGAGGHSGRTWSHCERSTRAAGGGSPTGHIVFTCQVFRDELTNQICIMNADGTGFTAPDEQRSSRPLLSLLAPDGQSVLYSSNESGEYAVYEMDLSNGTSRRLTYLGDDYAPAVSPDGSRVVFVHNDGQRQTLWIVDRAGGTPRRLAVASRGDSWDPVWSPDGDRILFASTRAGGVQLFVADAVGSSVRQLTDIEGLRGRSDWSPDGAFLATYAGSAWHREIVLLDLEGSILAQPTEGGNNLAPSISPDGEWIAFTSYRDHYEDDNGCEIYVMRKDGSDIRRLTNNDYCDWQPRWGR